MRVLQVASEATPFAKTGGLADVVGALPGALSRLGCHVTVVIRGADGVDATVEGEDLEELVRQPVSLMPADLASTLSAEELVDVVTWLETLRGRP